LLPATDHHLFHRCPQVLGEFDAAEAKVNEALTVKPDLFDAISTMASEWTAVWQQQQQQQA
jgi:hypothetical protein